MKKEVVIYQSKVKQLGVSLLGFLMTMMCFLFFIVGWDEKQYILMVIGVIAGVFFGLCEVFIIKQLFKGKLLVKLTEEGFYDFSSAVATKELLVPWSNIARIENVNVFKQEFVSVYLKESEAVLGHLSSLQRKAVKANIKLGFGEINITVQNAKGYSNNKLKEEMEDFLKAFHKEQKKLI